MNALLEHLEHQDAFQNALLENEDYEYLYYGVVCKIKNLYTSLQLRFASNFIGLQTILYKREVEILSTDARVDVEGVRNFLVAAWFICHDGTIVSRLDRAIKLRKIKVLAQSPLTSTSQSVGSSVQLSASSDQSMLWNTVQGLQQTENQAALLNSMYSKYGFGISEREEKTLEVRGDPKLSPERAFTPILPPCPRSGRATTDCVCLLTCECKFICNLYPGLCNCTYRQRFGAQVSTRPTDFVWRAPPPRQKISQDWAAHFRNEITVLPRPTRSRLPIPMHFKTDRPENTASKADSPIQQSEVHGLETSLDTQDALPILPSTRYESPVTRTKKFVELSQVSVSRSISKGSANTSIEAIHFPPQSFRPVPTRRYVPTRIRMEDLKKKLETDIVPKQKKRPPELKLPTNAKPSPPPTDAPALSKQVSSDLGTPESDAFPNTPTFDHGSEATSTFISSNMIESHARENMALEGSEESIQVVDDDPNEEEMMLVYSNEPSPSRLEVLTDMTPHCEILQSGFSDAPSLEEIYNDSQASFRVPFEVNQYFTRPQRCSMQRYVRAGGDLPIDQRSEVGSPFSKVNLLLDTNASTTHNGAKGLQNREIRQASHEPEPPSTESTEGVGIKLKTGKGEILGRQKNTRETDRGTKGGIIARIGGLFVSTKSQ
jgi:hypothetical protein